jgi:hypothetical protein
MHPKDNHFLEPTVTLLIGFQKQQGYTYVNSNYNRWHEPIEGYVNDLLQLHPSMYLDSSHNLGNEPIEGYVNDQS